MLTKSLLVVSIIILITEIFSAPATTVLELPGYNNNYNFNIIITIAVVVVIYN